MTETIYERLKAPFDRTHKDPRGLDYITGEQCASRLNEVLGPAGWDFSVKDHGYDAESDEIWVLGRLVATLDGTPTAREQFGSQKHNRKRDTNAILDYGFDLKGAATDAMKKCASLLGVGLYLHEKDGPPIAQPTPIRQAAAPARPAPARPYREVFGTDDGAPQRTHGEADDPETVAEVRAAQDAITCDICDEPLTETRFRDGTTWSAKDLQGFGKRKHGKTLCMMHYREANAARTASLMSAG